MQPIKNSKKQQKLLVAILIALLLCIMTIIFILFYLDSKKTALIEILIAPSTAKITIDNTNFKNSKTSKIEPGNHIATISADGFITKTVEISLTNNKTTKLYIILNPEDGNENWYSEHPSEDIRLSIISDYLTTEQQEEYAKEHPISTILPISVVEVDQTTYDWTEFRIDYGEFNDCKTSFCIKITDSTGGNKERAIRIIEEKGFDPNQYEIIYVYTPVEALN